jgi:ornithine carbamoyltransferase
MSGAPSRSFRSDPAEVQSIDAAPAVARGKRDLLRARDLSAEDFHAILDLARRFKLALKRREPTPELRGKSLAMIFEKPSLRTRATFELGMAQLGGHAVYLPPADIGLGRRETIADIARNLERWFDLIMARVFRQETLEEFARHCRAPIINALSDEEHPCQALADYMTLVERFDSLRGVRLTFIGDGNNVCHSLMALGARLGVRMTVCGPKGFEPSAEVVRAHADEWGRSGGALHHTYDPIEAVREADAVYTDVWTSMGQEDEAEARRRAFEPYQVNAALLARAPGEALVMHDLPARRGEEITDEVLDGSRCIAFDQAENRLHAQKGLMVFLDASR